MSARRWTPAFISSRDGGILPGFFITLLVHHGKSASQQYPATGYPQGSEHADACSQRIEQEPASKALTRLSPGYTPGRGRDREGVSPHWRERSVWRLVRIPPIQETNVGFGQYWPVCDQSSTSSENGRDPCRGQSARARPVRSGRLSSPDRVFPGYRHSLPPPESGGGGGRRPGGVGATRRDLRVPPPAGRGRAPSPVPTPRGDAHHGPLSG